MLRMDIEHFHMPRELILPSITLYNFPHTGYGLVLSNTNKLNELRIFR